jgi:hypothetical protein
MLYHFSEEPDIARFEPRLAKNADHPVVWAVDAQKSRNFLCPRECPRVTFFAGADTSADDVKRYLGSSASVLAFESAWLDRVRQLKLFCYHLSADTFHMVDRCAGFFQSTETVIPQQVEVIDDVLKALADRGVEIRVLASLWQLHDAVIASTLSYSIMRMRNAIPRPE